MKYDRIYCFGDSITLGCNDSTGLGWPGRLGNGNGNGNALTHQQRSVAVYNLGINGDTSLDIAVRWRQETAARSRNATGLMLFSFGFNDASAADGASLQVPLQDSVDCARSLLLEAKSIGNLLWIGPTPLDESSNPLQTEFASWETLNSDIARYDSAYAQLAQEIGVDYLRLFPDFLQNPRYSAALIAGDQVHPGDDGYAMIAERIAGWNRWQQVQ